MKKTILLLIVSFIYFGNIQAQVAKYTFNLGNANDEISTNHGTVIGATLTSDRFGNPKAAYSFNGTNQYIDFGDKAIFQLRGSYTISLWFSPGVVPQWGPVLQKRELSAYTQYFIGMVDDLSGGGASNKISCFSGGAFLKDTATLIPNNWYHIVMVVDTSLAATRKQAMYVNNRLAAFSNTPFTPNAAVGGPLRLGNNNGTVNFTGKIDDVVIYHSALNANQVAALYNEAEPVSDLSVLQIQSPLANSNIDTPFHLMVSYKNVGKLNIYDSFQTEITANGIVIDTSSVTFSWIIGPVTNHTINVGYGQKYTPTRSGVHKICVYHKNVINDKNYSNDTLCVLVNSRLAAKNLVMNSTFKLYPNPANQVFTVETDNLNWKTIDIVSINGKKVMSSNDKTIQIGDLSLGVYFVELKDKNGIVLSRQKLIKS